VTKENYKKIDLINFISSKIGFSKDYSKKLTNDLLLILSENIVNGYLNLKNIGTFKLLYKKKRIGRNPKTNDEFIISARKTVKFIPAKLITKNSNI
tara:strand:- start:492 stop:779 length:288 start_codon:yes stop_codon:yes gene_type:complete